MQMRFPEHWLIIMTLGLLFCPRGRYINRLSSNYSTFGTPSSRNHYKRHYIEAVAVGKGFNWISFGVFPKAK